MYGLAIALPPLVGWSHYELDPTSLACGATWLYQDMHHVMYPLWYLASSLALPLLIKAVCYYQLYKKVNIVARRIRCANRISVHTDRLAKRVSIASMTQSSQSSAAFSWGSNPPTGFILYNNIRAKSTDLRQERRLAKIMVLMVGVSMVTWLPYGLSSVLLGLRSDIPSEILVLTSLLAKASVVYDPIIYVVMNKKLRGSFMKLLPCRDNNRVTPMTNPNTRPSANTTNATNATSRTSKRLSQRISQFSHRASAVFQPVREWPSPNRVLNHPGLATITEASHCASVTLAELSQTMSPFPSNPSSISPTSNAFVSEDEGLDFASKKYSLPATYSSTGNKTMNIQREISTHKRRSTKLSCKAFHPTNYERKRGCSPSVGVTLRITMETDNALPKVEC